MSAQGLVWRVRKATTADGPTVVLGERRAFLAYVAQFPGDEFEIIARPLARRQSHRRRGFYHGVMKPAFHRFLSERFRESYGDVTLREAHDLLIRLVLALADDVERPSTAIEEMDDQAYEDFLFRAEVLLTRLGVDYDDAQPDPVKRYEDNLRGRSATA